MKKSILILLCFVPGFSFSQIQDLFGVYELADYFPTKYYLSLECDSTYHLITHYDFGGEKSYNPPLQEKAKWSLTNDSILILQDLSSKRKQFIAQSDGQILELRKKESLKWRKIFYYNEHCQTVKFARYMAKGLEVAHLVPDKQIKSFEEYDDGRLSARTTYFELSQNEIDSINAKYKFKEYKDPVMNQYSYIYYIELGLMPVSKIEEWIDGSYTIRNYDKLGNKIR